MPSGVIMDWTEVVSNLVVGKVMCGRGEIGLLIVRGGVEVRTRSEEGAEAVRITGRG